MHKELLTTSSAEPDTDEEEHLAGCRGITLGAAITVMAVVAIATIGWLVLLAFMWLAGV